MAKKLTNKIVMASVLIVVVFVTGVRGQVHSGASLPFAQPFYQRPVYAQFLSSSYVIKGDSNGISIIEIGSKKVTEKALEDTVITAMMSNPHKEGHVAFASDQGDVYLSFFADNVFEYTKLDLLQQASVGIVKSILFHDSLPDKILFAGTDTIALCSFVGNELIVNKTVSMEPYEDRIVFAFSDIISDEWFLISGTKESRYRCNWETGELVSIPEKTLEHGAHLKKGGFSYFALGENQEYFNISFMSARPTFIKRYPQKPNVFMVAAIGVSPMIVTLEKRNHYDLWYLANNRFLTFSIDVDRNNFDHLIFTTSSGVVFSDDGGQSWGTLE